MSQNREITRLRKRTRSAAAAVAFVAASFSLTVALLLLVNNSRTMRAQPLDSPALLELREQARKDPKQLEWVERFRDMDQIARHAFFAGQSFARAGAALLLAGVGILVLALRVHRAMAPPQPDPSSMPSEPDVAKITLARRTSLAGMALSLCAFGAAIAWLFAPQIAPPPMAVGTPSAGAPAIATAPATAPAGDPSAEWPALRGPNGLGLAPKAKPPTDWNGPSGKNIRWKVEVPMAGFGSPVVWGDKIFLTGANERSRKVFCFDSANGQLKWTHDVQAMPGTPAEAPSVGEDTGHAASTPATDGSRVFAIFANGDLVCVDGEGKKVWGLNMGVPDNPYGHASSLLVWRNLLIVQYDHHAEAFISALDAASGRVAWEVKRKVEASWTTPALVTIGDREILVTSATPLVIAYDPKTGRQLWSNDVLSGELAPSPTAAEGKVFVNDDGGRLFAFDASTGKQAWQVDVNTPDISSPVASGPFIWMANSAATVVCCETATGKQIAEVEVEEGFCASPIAAGGRIFTFDRNGDSFIFDAAKPETKPVRLQLGEKVFATPAFVGDQIFVRGEKNLYCIGAKP